MNLRPLVAAMAAGSLLLGSVAAYAQAEAVQREQQQYQDAREHGYWHPNDPSNPRPGYNTPVQQTPGYRVAPGYRAPVQQSNDRYYHRDPRQDNRYDPRHDNRYDPRYYQHWDQNQRRYMPVERHGNDWRGRGAGPEHNWYRGSYLPREYRSHNYVVDDWRAHHLYAPPSGYHWVQSPGGDYVLAAIATGLIAAILLNQ
jgi:Ni/Co efflux regulator RcnB|nr:RcnB family protein [Caldimonas sp.]